MRCAKRRASNSANDLPIEKAAADDRDNERKNSSDLGSQLTRSAFARGSARFDQPRSDLAVCKRWSGQFQQAVAHDLERWFVRLVAMLNER
jgi:hypothetical protein